MKSRANHQLAVVLLLRSSHPSPIATTSKAGRTEDKPQESIEYNKFQESIEYSRIVRHMKYALGFCLLLFLLWYHSTGVRLLNIPYPTELLHWHWGDHIIASAAMISYIRVTS